MSAINYSKWDNIEISDDEDDVHPNIDTPSLFRWRHQARIDRMKESEDAKKCLENEKIANQRKLKKVKDNLQSTSSPTDMKDLKKELTDLEKQEADYNAKEAELKNKDRLTAWNVDTLSKEVSSRTLINSYKEPVVRTDEQEMDDQKVFSETYEKDAKKFGMLQRPMDSERFLLENPHMVCKETANILVVWCVDLKVEEKENLVKHVAHQTMVMQFILQLASSLEVAPQQCTAVFFKRFKQGEKQYMDAFHEELSGFLVRVKERADARITRVMAEIEEEEKAERLGPGGLDPVEVFESLPEQLQECFEKKDIAALQVAMSQLPSADMEYHLKRCIDSGMWVPGKEEDDAEDGTSQEADGEKPVEDLGEKVNKEEQSKESDDEEIYENARET